MRVSLSRYLILAKRWAWLLIVGVVICSGATYLITKFFIPPTYDASAKIIIKVSTSESQNDNTLAAIAMLPTFTQVVVDPKVLKPVATAHKMDLQLLTQAVTATQQSNTLILQIDVKDKDPQLATQLANQVGQSFLQNYLTPVYTIPPNSLPTYGQITGVLLPAVAPILPLQPKPSLDTLVGGAVGLGLAIAIIVLFEWLNDHLSTPDEVQRLLGVDLLAVLPALSKRQRQKKAEETPELAEGCRTLCASLNIAQIQRPFKLVMVTSALASEGKSTIASNIASFLAMSGKRVLLVDSDLRHPVLDQHFQLENRHGLSNALLEMRSDTEPELNGQPTEIPSLRVLTAGILPSNPSELLQSPLAHQLFNHFRNTQHFDYVIFDAPPLLPIADAQILASYIQVTILVADVSKTPRKALVRAKEVLNRTGTRILGVTLNKSEWFDFSKTQDDLSNIQERPRADIIQSPISAPTINRAIEVTNTAALPSAKNSKS
ncbi:MAG TPA: polysaccharide biosynthesis tyrosine autokinase [Ktedonobacteraceae bacterium]|jgi:capsular exopolysaccharide synthesis family protein